MIISDNGVGLPNGDSTKIKVGLGIGNTRQRLATMYPDRQTFSMRTPSEGGTEVRILIPLHFAGSEEESLNDEQPAVADR